MLVLPRPPISGLPDNLVMTSDRRVNCGHGFSLRVARGGVSLRRDGLERCYRRRCDNRASRTCGANAVVPHLLAANLRVSAPHWLQHTRRAGPHPIVFSRSPPGENASPRIAGKRALSEFFAWGAQTLSGRRADAAAYLKTRERNSIHFNRRARCRGAPSPARRS